MYHIFIYNKKINNYSFFAKRKRKMLSNLSNFFVINLYELLLCDIFFFVSYWKQLKYVITVSVKKLKENKPPKGKKLLFFPFFFLFFMVHRRVILFT